MTEPSSGNPPKSADRIRAALEKVHRDQGAPAPLGPLSAGLQGDARLVIASFLNREVAQRFQKALSQAGVMYSLETERREVRVLVDYDDRARASEILAEHQRHDPDHRPAGIRREFDWAILCGVAGATLGYVLLARVFRFPRDLGTIFVFAVLGILMGHFCDRVRSNHRHGLRQFGIAEFLIVCTFPALVALLWWLIPSVLKR